MAPRILSLIVSFVALLSLSSAGDNKWLSPEYKDIYKNPLPFPPVKKPITFVHMESLMRRTTLLTDFTARTQILQPGSQLITTRLRSVSSLHKFIPGRKLLHLLDTMASHRE